MFLYHSLTNFYVVTAIAMNSFSPDETAFTKAVRSAQIAPPYEAFSTLHPW